MRGLRSRWTVVALVPAFFLAGFGIVAALAGGPDEPDAASGPLPAGTAPGEAEAVTVIGETDSAGTPLGADPATTTESGSASGVGEAATTGSRGGGGAGGRPPPAPAPGEIAVDYGRWEGIFELESPEIVPDFGQATLAAGFAYRGGVDCPVGLVRVKVWFFGEPGLVGTALWESVQSTGDGGEITGREPLPFEAYGQIDQEATSAAVRFTAVECL
jgi:hypothetical protein